MVPERSLHKGAQILRNPADGFDAEITAVEEALFWFMKVNHRALIIHSDSASTIACAGHTGAGPGQWHAVRIHRQVSASGASTEPWISRG